MRARLRTCGRRLTSGPLVLVVAALALIALTVALLTAPIALAAGRPLRLLRFSAFLLVYTCVDVAGVVAAGWFWVRCLRTVPGQPRSERLQAHSYALLARLLDRLYRTAERFFTLRMQVSPPVPQAARAASPLVVLARHAGPGDSFLLMHTLLCDAGVRPQLVLKRFLGWDPCLDVLIGRTPHVFVPAHRPERTVDAIAALGAALRPGEAVVVFPEGGNFTQERRARAISWLRRHGETRRAVRARQRRHVLPPQPDGALALLGAVGAGTDVVIVAHTGWDRMDSPSRVWRGVPLREPLRATWWRVPRSEIPVGRGAEVEWLEQQWSRVDSWIEERVAHGQPTG